MKITKHLQLFVIVILFSSNCWGQKIYFDLGIATARFNEYENSFGVNTLDDSGFSKPISLYFEGGTRFNIFKERVHFDLGIRFSNYKIRTSFYSGNLRVPTNYNLSYIGVKPGITIDLLKINKLSLQVHTHISYDWLLFGTNKYRNITVDLTAENTFDRTLLSLHRGIGLNYELNERFQIYADYNYGFSFKEINQDSVDGELYSIVTNSFGLGLTYRFKVLNSKRLDSN